MSRRLGVARGAATCVVGAVVGVLLAGCAAGGSGSRGTGTSGASPSSSTGASSTGATASASSGGSADVTASASASAGSSDGASVTAIAVSIAGGKVNPAPDRIEVKRGSTVKLTVTSDVADEVHVHGIDREFALSPGQPASTTFTVTDPGVYEVETHKTGKTLFQLVVR